MQNSAALAKIGGISGTFREKPYQGLHAFFLYKNIEIGERLKMFLTCSYFLAFQKPLFFQLLRKG